MNGGRASYQMGAVAVVVLDSTATPVLRAGRSLFPPQILAEAEGAVLVQRADLPRPAAGELPGARPSAEHTVKITDGTQCQTLSDPFLYLYGPTWAA